MKKVAVDCQINFLRNTRVGDPRIIGKDGTSECDYAECVYDCWDPTFTDEDYTTYDVYYIDETIEAITRVLQEYFKTNFSISMEGVVDLIQNVVYPPEIKYVQYAVQEILNIRTIFLNRYGQKSYLQKDQDILFLTLDYPLSDLGDQSVNVSDYTANLIGILDIPLEEVKNPVKEKEKMDKVQKIAKYDPFTPEFEKIFYSLDIDTLSRLLENAIQRRINDNETTFSRKILMRLSENTYHHPPAVPFASLWYVIPKPVTEIKKVERRLEEKSAGKGRKPKEGMRTPDKIDYKPTWDEDTEPVYFHILYSIEPGRQDYAAVSNYKNVTGKIRLFVPSEGQWRDATPIEQVVYSKKGQELLETFLNPYEDLDIHGNYYSGPVKTFRVVSKFMEKQPLKKSVKRKKKDKRKDEKNNKHTQ